MEQPLDTFRSSTWGWLRGTLAGWGTIALVPIGILLTAPGEWGRWPLLISAAAIAIVLWKWFESLAARYDICPDRLIVRDPASPDVEHLLVLAREKSVPTDTDPMLPYAAAALIKELDG